MPGRTPTRFSIPLLVVASLLACRGSQGAQDPPPAWRLGPPSTEAQVEALPVDLPSPATAFAWPWGAGGPALLALRDGRVVRFDEATSRLLEPPLLDLRGEISQAGEGGLLGLATHPRFAENGLLFVHYTDREGDTVVRRYRVARGARAGAAAATPAADPASAVNLLTLDQPYRNHNGGALRFGPDGYLYLGLGDGGAGNDPACRAQGLDNWFGKILRLDVDRQADRPPHYAIPADNPFRQTAGALPEIWLSGLRNPWQFSFDRATGDLWIGDVGQNAREEVDVHRAGAAGGVNFGWKVMEGTRCAGSAACPASTPPCGDAHYAPPAIEYDHGFGCSVTGGWIYRGERLPALAGQYLFADYCAQRIWTANVGRPGEVVVARPIPGAVQNIIAFGERPDGELLAASLSGALHRIVAAGRPAATRPPS